MKIEQVKYQLMDLGLTDYESKGYTSLLEKQTLTATELSRLSLIPRTRIYEILQKLIEKGLCVEILGKIKKYKAVAPEMAMDRLLEHQRLDFSLKEKNARLLGDLLQKKYLEGSNNRDPLDYIELLRDPQQVARMVIQLVAGATSEILVFVKPPFSNPKDRLEKQNVETTSALKSEVDCQTLYQIGAEGDERKWQFRQIDHAVKNGEKARIIDELPLKMVIVDESKVIFAMEDYHITQNRQTSLLIEHHALARSLKILFETLWAQGRDYHELLDMR